MTCHRSRDWGVWHGRYRIRPRGTVPDWDSCCAACLEYGTYHAKRPSHSGLSSQRIIAHLVHAHRRVCPRRWWLAGARICILGLLLSAGLLVRRLVLCLEGTKQRRCQSAASHVSRRAKRHGIEPEHCGDARDAGCFGRSAGDRPPIVTADIECLSKGG